MPRPTVVVPQNTGRGGPDLWTGDISKAEQIHFMASPFIHLFINTSVPDTPLGSGIPKFLLYLSQFVI